MLYYVFQYSKIRNDCKYIAVEADSRKEAIAKIAYIDVSKVITTDTSYMYGVYSINTENEDRLHRKLVNLVAGFIRQGYNDDEAFALATSTM